MNLQLSDSERAGQLLIVGIDGTEMTSDLEKRLRRLVPGGIILFARNLLDSRQVASFCRELAAVLPVPPFLAIDQEGGRVNRLKGIFPPLPDNLSLARAEDPEAGIRGHGTLTGQGLRLLGFNLNFAPVLDLSEAESLNGIGDRAYGTDPERVARLAGVFLDSQAHAGVLGCGKHFPGLGGGRVDSHQELPAIRRTAEELWREDLAPYRLLRESCPLVMVGHAWYPALQGNAPAPATLSRAVVTDLLRERIRYPGLILTDDLEMGAVDQRRDPGEVALEAVRAGSDLAMYCKSWDRIEAAHAALSKAMRTGTLTTARVDASLTRIFHLKKRLPPPREAPPFDADSFQEVCRHLALLQERVARA